MIRIACFFIGIHALVFIASARQNEPQTLFNPLLEQRLSHTPENQRGEKEQTRLIHQDRNEMNRLGNFPLYLSKHRSPIHHPSSSLPVIIPDLQVNENVGQCSQYYPAIAANEAGNFVLVWEDNRNDMWTDIFAQRYNADSTPQGSNFQVNEGNGCSMESSPQIAMDKAGNFVIVWTDMRNGTWDIYAQRYSSDGTPQGTNFKVNDDTNDAYQFSPAIAMEESGRFVIVWEDERNLDSLRDIYAQRFEADGTTSGVNFRVNDDHEVAAQSVPSIAMNASGQFVVAWQGDVPLLMSTLFARRFDADGNALGAGFQAIESSIDTYPSPPAAAMDDAGNFVIVWVEIGDYERIVYARKFDADGTLQGNSFRVNESVKNSDFTVPSISMDHVGNFVIAWVDSRNYHSDIYAQRYNSNGIKQGINFINNDDSMSSEQTSPAVAMLGTGNFITAWVDLRNGFSDIYAQRYDSSGTAQNANFRVTDENGCSDQKFPKIATDGFGNFVVAWLDARHDTGDWTSFDIYAQRYTQDGTPIGSNFPVNELTGSSDAWLHPSLAMDKRGNFVIVWNDWRDGKRNIYAQRYGTDGTAQGENFKVNDQDGQSHTSSHTAIAISESGGFFIVWSEVKLSNQDIYAQMYDAEGFPQGGNFIVNDDDDETDRSYPQIAASGAGDFVIVWVQKQEYPLSQLSDIYARRFHGDGTAAGGSFKVNDDQEISSQTAPTIAADSTGNFIIAWKDNRMTKMEDDLFAQRYEADGIPQGNNFQVNQITAGAIRYLSHATAMNSAGNFIITWAEMQNDFSNMDIYSQRYTADGAALGGPLRVNAEARKEQYEPDVKLWNNRIYHTWVSSHAGGTSYDIWANVLKWNISNDVNDPTKPGLLPATDFRLDQNYPNPFNPATEISFVVPKDDYTVLKIYDLSGRLIVTLLNEFKPAGCYALQWNGKNEQNETAASGIYFYRLSSGGYSEAKRMLLLR
ncbi:MAG: T9SS C-terminal target domain-containing protein [Calditrichaeota bacterium]|nr:MAG: T9SS C-terminal target domain-containing protein [Calditrichota bacterium]